VTPEDVAGVVTFLCSPDADMIRGQTVVIDGGWSLLTNIAAAPGVEGRTGPAPTGA
jgi:NAD(P)-dependent dehydrogenase (short-subunit alcohol dehydrogenase family)